MRWLRRNKKKNKHSAAIIDINLTKDIAIIGMACRFPGANNYQRFWENLKNSVNSIQEISKDRWDIEQYYTTDITERNKTVSKWMGALTDIDKFDAAFFGISGREADILDPQQRFLLELTWQCFEDAYYRPEDYQGNDVGVYIGAGNYDYKQLMEQSGLDTQGHQGTGGLVSLLSNRISHMYDFHGPSQTIDTACSSGLFALHAAISALRQGECELAVAGGISLLLTPTYFVSFSQARMLSPTGQCHTFDALADGYVRGEGAGVLLLKPLDKALADQDRIHAIIKGSAINHGGKARTLTTPNPYYQAQVIQKAWLDARVTPDKIDYIEAHGTGTPLGDPIEMLGLARAFKHLEKETSVQCKASQCAVGSVKTNIGHLEPASGIAGVIKVILSMQNKYLPGLQNFTAPNPKMHLDEQSPFRLLTNGETWFKPRYAGVSAFGFGGANAHIVLTPAPIAEEKNFGHVKTKQNTTQKPYYLITLSAKTDVSLTRKEKELQQWLLEESSVIDKSFLLSSLSYTLNACRSHFNHRISFAVSSIESLQNTLTVIIAKQPRDNFFSGVVDNKKLNDAATKKQVLGSELEKLKLLDLLNNPNEYKSALESLANLYIKGYDLDWELLHQGEAKQKISLPTYPFMKERYWVSSCQNKFLSNSNKDSKTDLFSHIDAHAMSQPKTRLKEIANDINARSENTFLGNHIMEEIKSSMTEKKLKNIANENSIFTLESLREQVTHVFQTTLFLKSPEIDINKAFGDYGIDSILSIEFIKALTGRFNIELSAAKIYDFPTIHLLSQHIFEKLQTLSLDTTSNFKVENNSIIEKTIAPLNFNGSIPPLKIKETLNNKNDILFMQAEQTNHGIEHIKVQEDGIAIVGIAGYFPEANTVDQFWINLTQGRSSIIEIPRTRWLVENYYSPHLNENNKTYSKWGGFLNDIDKFEPLFFNISPQEAEVMDPQQRLFLETSWHALEDAGYSNVLLDQRRCGVHVGVMNNDYQEVFSRMKQSITAQQVMGNSNSILAARIAYHMNFKGPVITIDTACSSSLVAIHTACQALKNQEADMMLAGGVTLYLTETPYIGMSRAGMLSPEGKCKTFDNSADGFVPGEGCAVVVLKRHTDAIRDKDNIYGIIRGSGVNQDGKSSGITAPNGESQTALEKDVYQKYRINPKDISYVETHGTGTKLGDPIEVEALTRAFLHYTNKKNYCAIGSVKSNLGHTSAASGVTSVIKVLLQMKHKQLVPTINFTEENEHIDFKNSPFYVNTELRDWCTADNRPRLAAINSFGFSGTNCHMVIEEAPKNVVPVTTPKLYYLITLSAKTNDSLNQKLKELQVWLKEKIASESLSLSSLSYTLNIGRSHFNHRLSLVVNSIGELKQTLQAIAENKKQSNYFKGVVSKELDDAAIYKQVLKSSLENLKSLSLRENHKEYKETLDSLANLYVKGYDLDWELLHQGEAKLRISLPTYPFMKQRYWIPESEIKISARSNNLSTTSLHPLITNNVSTLEEQCFHTILQGHEFFLRDHVVRGQKILPGVAYLEMSRAAGMLASPAQSFHVIKQIIWSQPIVVEELKKTAIGLFPTTSNGINFEIRTEQENQDAIIHAQGQLTCETIMPPVRLDIPDIEVRCTHTLEKSFLYAQFAGQGLAYGPSFQSVSWVNYAETEALGLLELPPLLSESEVDNRDAYVLHPSLMDGALQVVGAWMMAKTKIVENHSAQINSATDILSLLKSDVLYLPFAIDEVRIYQALPDRCYAYVREAVQKIKMDATTSSDHSSTNASTHQRYDITLLSAEGDVLVDIKGFMVRPIKRQECEQQQRTPTMQATLQPKTTSTEIDSLDYYAPMWVREPLSKVSDVSLSVVKDSQHPLAETVLIFETEVKRFEQLKAQLQHRNSHTTVIFIEPGENYKQLNPMHYQLNPNQLSDYEQLIEVIHTTQGQGTETASFIRYGINTWPLHQVNEKPSEEIAEEDEFSQRLNYGLYVAFYLTKALLKAKHKGTFQWLHCEADSEQSIDTFNANLAGMVIGFANSLYQEKPHYSYHVLSLDRQQTTPVMLRECIQQELWDNAASIPRWVRYRGKERWVRRWTALASEDSIATDPTRHDGLSHHFRHEGVYLITGGLGGLGFVIANYLTRTYQAKIVLTGRSGHCFLTSNSFTISVNSES